MDGPTASFRLGTSATGSGPGWPSPSTATLSIVLSAEPCPFPSTTTYFVYGGPNVLYTRSGTTDTDYVYAAGLLVLRKSGADVRYVHQDHLGNVRLVTPQGVELSQHATEQRQLRGISLENMHEALGTGARCFNPLHNSRASDISIQEMQTPVRFGGRYLVVTQDLFTRRVMTAYPSSRIPVIHPLEHLVRGVLGMKIRCDKSLPAIYIDFRDGETYRETVEEDCDLVIGPSNDLIGLRVWISRIRHEFPQSDVMEVTYLCRREGWTVEMQETTPVLSVTFRKDVVAKRYVPWVAMVDVSDAGRIVGIEIVLTGDTNGEVQLGWLCP